MVSFYSIVHFSPAELRTALAEMHRVLRPAGRLLLAFHAGDEIRHVDELLGRPVSLDFRFFDPESVVGELGRVGFVDVEATVREPYPGVEYPSRRAYLRARRGVG